MLISIDWSTKIITIPQSYLTLIVGTLYELDTDQFRKDLGALLAGEAGIVFDDAHKHTTSYSVAGVTYARALKIINGYSITFEDGQYTVRLAGSNNDIFDVENGILNQNQVQIISTNSAGLVEILGGGATAAEIWAYDNKGSELERVLGLSQEFMRIFDPVWETINNKDCLTSATKRIYENEADLNNNVNPISSYTITATYDTDGNLEDYKAIKI